MDNEVNECEASEIESAGYGWILDAEVTIGTTYPFHAEFFLAVDSADPNTRAKIGIAIGLVFRPPKAQLLSGSSPLPHRLRIHRSDLCRIVFEDSLARQRFLRRPPE